MSKLALAFLLHIVRSGPAFSETDVKRVASGWRFPENAVRSFVPALCCALLLISSVLSLPDSGFCCYEPLRLEWKKLCGKTSARGGTG